MATRTDEKKALYNANKKRANYYKSTTFLEEEVADSKIDSELHDLTDENIDIMMKLLMKIKAHNKKKIKLSNIL